MNSKILNHIKKLMIVLAILMLCITNATYAFSIGDFNQNKQTNSSIMSLLNRLLNLNTGKHEEYNLEDLQKELETMKNMPNLELNQITGAIDKLPNGAEKEILSSTVDFSKLFSGIQKIDLQALLEKLTNTISSIIGGNQGGIGSLLGGNSLKADIQETITMDAKTAVEFAGKDAKAKLSANVYMHTEKTDKWALLIHPFMLQGKTIANNVGTFYYEKGYNVIAPDLRGFGNSEGSVALGCLESMDIYDWLVKLNAEYDVEQVIVHGISLGGATTNYLSGIDGFINNGPTKINTVIKPIRELKVVGLVEDCGYVDMTEFASKSTVMLFSQLDNENFDYYSKATNSLQYCDLPMLIIHGTSDTTVKPKNAEIVKNTVKGDVEVWTVDGGVHAFIIMGMKKEEYKTHVQEFIDTCTTERPDVEAPDVETPELETPEVEIPNTQENNGKTNNSIMSLLRKLFNLNK